MNGSGGVEEPQVALRILDVAIQCGRCLDAEVLSGLRGGEFRHGEFEYLCDECLGRLCERHRGVRSVWSLVTDAVKKGDPILAAGEAVKKGLRQWRVGEG